ncbi:hypothetical protein [Dactylosporangium sp. CA-233914]|uniref:hypothetical protein n=1 Tax=Dactylosporangium sp. CA-233914 TaxID=3239934 RepID=UPI003D8D5492
MTNDDLNKIRDAARRARDEAASPAPPPRPPRDSFVAPRRPSRPDPPRYTFEPEPEPVPVVPAGASAGRQLWIRLQRGGWTFVTMLLLVWLVGVGWETWFGHGYTSSDGGDVGRSAARTQAALVPLCLAAAFGLTLVFGRLGAWPALLAAGLVARFPQWVPDPVWQWSVRHAPGWCVSALSGLGGSYGQYLRPVAYVLYPVLVLIGLVQAVRRRR